MKRIELAKADVSALIDEYAASALTHRSAAEKGNHRAANKAHDRLAAVYRELRERGTAAREALLPLLSDGEESVRAWAAAHALEFRPELAEPVLEQLSTDASGLTGVAADMTLKEWRAGRLSFR